MDALYFHEDDYCQIELLPKSARSHCESEVRAIGDFSEKHRAPGGVGWTDVYPIKEPVEKVSERHLTLAEFRSIVGAVTAEARCVYTGYSSVNEPCVHTVGFGTGKECGVFADFNEKEIVEHIWLTLDLCHESLVPKAMDILSSLSSGLILVDWGWGVVLDLNDREAIEDYLRKRVSVFSLGVTQSKNRRWWQFWKW